VHATLGRVLWPQGRKKGKKNGDRWRRGSSLASVGEAGCALSRWRDLGSDFLCPAGTGNTETAAYCRLRALTS
jgi:hypothetical protein